MCVVELVRCSFSIPQEPRRAALFAAGAAIAFVCLVTEQFEWSFVGTFVPLEFAFAVRAFLMIALVEEVAKLGPIYGQLIEGRAANYKSFAILRVSGRRLRRSGKLLLHHAI